MLRRHLDRVDGAVVEAAAVGACGTQWDASTREVGGHHQQAPSSAIGQTLGSTGRARGGADHSERARVGRLPVRTQRVDLRARPQRGRTRAGMRGGSKRWRASIRGCRPSRTDTPTHPSARPKTTSRIVRECLPESSENVEVHNSAGSSHRPVVQHRLNYSSGFVSRAGNQ